VIGASGLTGCGDDSPAAASPPALLAVETQRCRQPNRFHGIGIAVGDGLVLTAGHTVEGELRDLRVDGEPARVVTIDRRTDLALLLADVPAADEPAMADPVTGPAQLISPGGTRRVTIDRRVTLVVEHATDRATYRRDVVVFTPGVVDGDSGSPLVDSTGHLLGVVIADQEGEGVAVTAPEIADLLESTAAADDLTLPEPPGRC
jgi:S1-C subfamily serine protease